jgi:hypothetical protein
MCGQLINISVVEELRYHVFSHQAASLGTVFNHQAASSGQPVIDQAAITNQEEGEQYLISNMYSVNQGYKT